MKNVAAQRAPGFIKKASADRPNPKAATRCNRLQGGTAMTIDRREFLKLAGIGGVVFASGLPGMSFAADKKREDFFFIQLSDSHWGFSGPPNPDSAVTLEKAVATVNSLDQQPDFIVFTGDLTHTTDDAAERRKRLAQFRDIVGKLKVKTVHFMPGEHDASLDRGERSGVLRQHALHVRPQGVHFSCSTTSPTQARSSATTSSTGCAPT
jgi:hypothetical protein